MALTEDQKQLIAKSIEKNKCEAERCHAALAQKQLIAKSKREAKRRHAALALKRAASKQLRRSSKQTSTPASDMTPEQRRRMEES